MGPNQRVIHGVITPIRRVPQLPIYKAIYRSYNGVITPFIKLVGAGGDDEKNKSLMGGKKHQVSWGNVERTWKWTYIGLLECRHIPSLEANHFSNTGMARKRTNGRSVFPYIRKSEHC